MSMTMTSIEVEGESFSLASYSSKWASLDATGRFRWLLGRAWAAGPVMHFIMLNPSTADANNDDPTIRKCVGFARRAGCGSIIVTNLFSFRSANPDDLLKEDGPIIGSETDHYVLEYTKSSTFTVVAWGQHVKKPKLRSRAKAMRQLLAQHSPRKVYALKLSDDGTPHHPLMLPYACTPFQLSQRWHEYGHQ